MNYYYDYMTYTISCMQFFDDTSKIILLNRDLKSMTYTLTGVLYCITCMLYNILCLFALSRLRIEFCF